MVYQGKNMVDIKQSNRSAILHLLHEYGGMSRKQIAKRLNLTPAAITIIVNEMIGDGILSEGMTVHNSKFVGRKEIIVGISSADFFALGVSINMDGAWISVTDLEGALLHKKFIPFCEAVEPEALVDMTGKQVEKVIARCGIDPDRVIGLGLSLRGIVNSTDGVSINTIGLWEMKNVALCRMFQDRFPFPVVLDNNIRALANAYIFLNKDPGISSMLFVRSETGIGAAMLINNRFYEGHHYHSAEIGHVTSVQDGRMCYCGNRGCLETVASMKSILRDVRSVYGSGSTPVLWRLTEGDADRIDFYAFMTAAQEGDKGASAVFENAVSYLSSALLSSMRILDVSKLVFYGRMFENDFFMKQLICRMSGESAFHIDPDMFETVSMKTDLEYTAAPILAVSRFYLKGGHIKN